MMSVGAGGIETTVVVGLVGHGVVIVVVVLVTVVIVVLSISDQGFVSRIGQSTYI